MPIRIHGDEVPVTGCGKTWQRMFDVYSWTATILISKEGGKGRRGRILLLLVSMHRRFAHWATSCAALITHTESSAHSKEEGEEGERGGGKGGKAGGRGTGREEEGGGTGGESKWREKEEEREEKE